MDTAANIAHLSSRAVMRMAGKDRFSFLQDLISQDMAMAQGGKPLFTAFLSPQGKYLFDFFVVPEGDALLLDIEAERRDDFIARLSRYRLRADVSIDEVAEARVYAAWDGEVEHAKAFTDPRLATLGRRIILPASESIATNAVEEDYFDHRYLHGVAEGMHEIPVNHAMLLEINFDALNAISLSKGCYLGQELTARTYYRGLIKRRYLPFRFDGLPPKKFGHILHNGFEIGEIRAVGNSVGLGLFHLEQVKPFIGGAPLVHDGVMYEVYIPDYLKETLKDYSPSSKAHI